MDQLLILIPWTTEQVQNLFLQTRQWREMPLHLFPVLKECQRNVPEGFQQAFGRRLRRAPLRLPRIQARNSCWRSANCART